jgi:thiamine-phosphate pyrophosphorylase
VLSYAITDSRSFGEDPTLRLRGLRAQVTRWRDSGVHFVQLREKDLPAGTLLRFANELQNILQGSGTRLTINARADVAAGVGAPGVHLTSGEDELTPGEVRRVYALAGRAKPVISKSCHSLVEVEIARSTGVDLILYGPVLEKRVRGEHVAEGTGFFALHAACVAAGTLPVLALGGVTAENTLDCIRAGARGVAGIRLFE